MNQICKQWIIYKDGETLVTIQQEQTSLTEEYALEEGWPRIHTISKISLRAWRFYPFWVIYLCNGYTSCSPGYLEWTTMTLWWQGYRRFFFITISKCRKDRFIHLAFFGFNGNYTVIFLEVQLISNKEQLPQNNWNNLKPWGRKCNYSSEH